MPKSMLQKAQELFKKGQEAQQAGSAAKATRLFTKADAQAGKAILREPRSVVGRQLLVELSIALAQPRSTVRERALAYLELMSDRRKEALKALVRIGGRRRDAPLAVFRWWLAFEAGKFDAAWRELVQTCHDSRGDQEFLEKHAASPSDRSASALARRVFFWAAVDNEAQLESALVAADTVNEGDVETLAGALRAVAVYGAPENPKQLMSLAGALADAGDAGTAIDCLERAVATEPALFGSFDFQGLTKRVAKAAEDGPARCGSVVLIARTQAAAGDFANARDLVAGVARHSDELRLYTEAALKRAQTPAATALAGWAAASCGRSSAAIPYLRTAAWSDDDVRDEVVQMVGDLLVAAPAEAGVAALLAELSSERNDQVVGEAIRRIGKSVLEQEAELLAEPRSTREALTHLLDVDPECTPILRVAARAAVALGDTDAALALVGNGTGPSAEVLLLLEPALEDVIARAPESAAAHVALTRARIHRGDANGVRDAIEAALAAIDPPQPFLESVFDLVVEGAAADVMPAIVDALAGDGRATGFVRDGMPRATKSRTVADLLCAIVEKGSLDAPGLPSAIRALSRVQAGDIDGARREIGEAPVRSREFANLVVNALDAIPTETLAVQDAAYLSCFCWWRSGCDDEAGRAAQRSLDASPSRAGDLRPLLDLVLQRSDRDQCRSALLARGVAYRALNAPTKAVRDLERAAGSLPERDARVTTELEGLWDGGSGCLESGLALLGLHGRAGRQEELAQVVADLLAAHPAAAADAAKLAAGAAAAPTASHTLLYEYGRALLGAGDGFGAASAFRRAIAADGADLDRVKAALRKHLAGDASVLPVRIVLGEMLVDAEAWTDALEVIDAGIRHDPGATAELVPLLARITASRGDLADGWFALANAQLRLSDFVAVGATCRRIGERHPSERPRLEELASRAVDLHPDEPATYHLLADVRAIAGNFDGAAQALHRCREAVPADFPNVTKALDELVGRSGDAVSVYEAQFAAWLSADDPAAALRVIERLYAVDPRGRQEKAIELLRRLTVAASKHARAFLVLGKVFVDGGLQMEAVEALVAARDVDSTVAREAISGLENALRLNPRDARNCFELGEAYTQVRDFKRAVSYHRRAVESDRRFLDRVIASETSSLSGFQDRTELYLSLGDLHADFRSDRKTAVGYFTDGLTRCREQETERQIALHRGLSLHALGRHERAYADFKRASAIKPVSREVFDSIREFWAGRLTAAAAVQPGDGATPERVLAAAGNLMRAGERTACLRLLQGFFTDDEQPGFAEAEFLKGLAFLRDGKTDLAVTCLRACIGRSAASSTLAKTARFLLADALVRRGNASDAAVEFEQILAVDSTFPRVTERLDLLNAADPLDRAPPPTVLVLSIGDLPVRGVERGGAGRS